MLPKAPMAAMVMVRYCVAPYALIGRRDGSIACFEALRSHATRQPRQPRDLGQQHTENADLNSLAMVGIADIKQIMAAIHL